MIHVDLGAVEAILPPEEQVPGEEYTHGSRLRVYVTSVAKGLKGPQITVSRTHPGLVRKLFALEVPEIAAGLVEIVALAREAGHRTKIASRRTTRRSTRRAPASASSDAAVRAVTEELAGEKIDIVDYDADLPTFVAHALSPAKVTSAYRARREHQSRPRAGARLPAVTRDRQGGSERASGRQAHGCEDRHPADSVLD